MKIVHLTSSFSNNSAGVGEVIKTIVRLIGPESMLVLTCKDSKPLHNVSGLNVISFSKKSSLILIFKMFNEIKRNRSGLIHLHGIWNVESLVLFLVVTCYPRTKYIISPHGMLEPWGLAQGKNKKRLAKVLFTEALLRKAFTVHCLNEKEKLDVQNFSKSSHCTIIPNTAC